MAKNCGSGGGDGEEQMRRRVALHLQRPAMAMAMAGSGGLGMQTCSSAASEETNQLVPVPPAFQSKALIKSRKQVRD